MLNGQLAADAAACGSTDARCSGWPHGRSSGSRRPHVPDHATFASMTVRENVQVALLSHRRRLGGWWARAAALCRDDADRLLARVGMVDQAERACSVLAYGDLKRVELAVALATNRSSC